MLLNGTCHFLQSSRHLNTFSGFFDFYLRDDFDKTENLDQDHRLLCRHILRVYAYGDVNAHVLVC